MLERDMENLIASHPADFFPRHVLILESRQRSFQGVGRFDLLFRDQFDFNVLMELKAVTARYEDASQLARYRDAMLANGTKRILMWLVAPSIPTSVREFLDHVGIQYSEIHIAEFIRVAEVRNYELQPNSVEPTLPQLFENGNSFPIVRRGRVSRVIQPPKQGITVGQELSDQTRQEQVEQLRSIIGEYLARPFDKTLRTIKCCRDFTANR